jgi:hypothetical protein
LVFYRKIFKVHQAKQKQRQKDRFIFYADAQIFVIGLFAVLYSKIAVAG